MVFECSSKIRWFVGYDRTVIVVKEGSVRGSKRANAAARLRARCRRFIPRVVGGEIRCKVADERIKRLGPEELNSMLPLIGTDKIRVCNDFESGGLEGVV